MSLGLNVSSAVLSVISFTFFIVGCIGYSTEKKVIRNVAWIVSNDDLNRQWIGLQDVYVIFGDMTRLIKLSTCDGKTCNVCAENGRAAFGLIIVGSIFAFISAGMSIFNSRSPSASTQYANMMSAVISGVTGVIGFGVFMHSCYAELQSDDDQALTMHYGPGSILTLIAFLLMWIVAAMQAAAALSTPPSYSRPPERAEAPAKALEVEAV